MKGRLKCAGISRSWGLAERDRRGWLAVRLRKERYGNHTLVPNNGLSRDRPLRVLVSNPRKARPLRVIGRRMPPATSRERTLGENSGERCRLGVLASLRASARVVPPFCLGGAQYSGMALAGAQPASGQDVYREAR